MNPNELLLELKKVGFPQEGKGKVVYGQNDFRLYDPTLEELFIECGKIFSKFRKNGYNYLDIRLSDAEWIAIAYIENQHHLAIGSNPSETLKMLYLKLNHQ